MTINRLTNLERGYVNSVLDSEFRGSKNLGMVSRAENAFSKYFEKEYSIPSEFSIDIRTNKNHIEVHLEYDKLEINEPQDVFFTIPENYEVCN